MEVQSTYVLSALDCIRVGLLHYELRDKKVSRGRAAVQLSTATEHLLREKLRLLECSRHNARLGYPVLVGMLEPDYVGPDEAASLKRYRKLRNAAVHHAAVIERNELSDFEDSTVEILRFLERFLRREIQIDPADEFDSCFVQMLRGEALDFHDKADLRSKAAANSVLVEHDVEEGVELANEAFDIAVRAVACGIGLPAASAPMDEVVDLMRQQGQNNEAYYFVHDEYHDLEPGAFRDHYDKFANTSEVEEYVRAAREAVIDLMQRAHRPRWESHVRDSWPYILEQVRAVSRDTCERIPEDPEGVQVIGTRVRIEFEYRSSEPEPYLELVTAVVRRELPELPRVFEVVFSPGVVRRSRSLSDWDDI